MTVPTTLAGWVEHCHAQALRWDDIGTVHARELARAWRSLGVVAAALDVVPVQWRTSSKHEHVAAVAAIAAGLELP